MASDLVVSSSATTHKPEQRPYDVFLSFRGEDTRDNFVSHLYEKLCGHQIKTFIDDDLERGDDFPPALLTAIQESSISIIVFSENYADSKWCLKEVVKIMECKNSSGQIVLPVFYRVDPTHVRNLTGNFGAAFHRLQGRSKGKMDLDKVRSHLMEVADISGWNSQIIRQESKLITEIVGDVLRKLNQISFSYSTNLIGIFHHIEIVESLLCLDKPDICIVGIWGMGGIGKTTIARAVFNHVCGRFDQCYLLLNVHDELKKQSVYALRHKLLSNIFEKDCQSMGSQSLRPDFIRRQLEQKKVFIVLDDVNDPRDLKELLEGQDYSFGFGSKILVTSRNRQVLKSVTDKIYEVEAMTEEDAMTLFSVNAFKQKYPTSSYKQVLMSVTDKIYEVEAMNGKDAMTLFSVNAFKKKYPTTSYKELSVRAVKYARGNPLALVVLGSALFERSKEEWVSALKGLEEKPNSDIQNVLSISYDILSGEEKKIFLDIACLFCGSHRDFIIEYYGESGLFKIKTLQDKSLITISSFSNTIEMHDLLKDMGRSIEQEKHFHKRERLWIPKDVCTVLAKKTGTAKIKAISLDMSGIKEMNLDGDAFRGMESLQYLKFYNNNSRYDEHEKTKVCFSKGCEYLLPGGLRYFHWDGFPAKHLPFNLCAENLVELRLNGSDVKKLWRGVQGTAKIKAIFLDMFGIKEMYLDGDAFGGMGSLQYLKFYSNNSRYDAHEKNKVYFSKGCEGLEYLPEALRYFHWDGFPAKHLPSNFCAENLVELRLDGSKLKKLWRGVQDLRNLRVISLNGCSNLTEIPDLSEAKNLRRINLRMCPSLKRWRNVHSNFCAENLVELHLDDSNVKKLWRGVQDLRNLRVISLNGCSKLIEIPDLSDAKNLWSIDLSRCRNVPRVFVSEALEDLDLSSCLNVIRFPDISSRSIKTLNLSGTDIEEVPSSIESLSGLVKLQMNGCRRLSIISTNICKLKSLKYLHFKGCVRLESFPEMLEPLELLWYLDLSDCVNLKTFPGDWYNLKSLRDLELSDTSITEVLPMYVGGTSLANLTCCSSRCNSNTKKITYVEEIEEIRPHLPLPLPGRGIKEPPPPQVQCIPYSTVTSTIKYLYLNMCHSLSMLSFANAIPSFSSLKSLDLSENNWESLPGNMDRLSNLEILIVNDCKNLRSIPKLPASLQTLDANNCESLECIHGLMCIETFWLVNCFKLEEATRYKILKHSVFRMMRSTKRYECVLPGTELPEWMGMKMGMGSSATIKLPSSQNVEYNWSRFRGFAFSLLFSPNTTAATTEQFCFLLKFQCILKHNDHRVISHLETISGFMILPVKSEQLFLWSWNFNPEDYRGELDLGELMGKEISFEFSSIGGVLAVNKCAVHPVFEGETVALAAVATATTKTNKPTPIRNPSKFSSSRRGRWLMIRSCSLSLRLSRTRFQRHHSASSKKRIRSFLYKSLNPVNSNEEK